MEIKWVSGDGGPHILMERKYLDLWAEQKETLYEKVCQIDDYIENLQLLDISLIVISEEMTHTAWIADEEGRGGIVIGLNYMDEEFDEKILIENVRKISNDDYSETGVEYKVIEEDNKYSSPNHMTLGQGRRNYCFAKKIGTLFLRHLVW